MFNKNIRSYEVSIWTLQDSFITVLKQSNLENKGQIQDAKMTISDDGTRELSFSLPMYYYEGPNKIENPNWYNVRNGNLLVNMRKIKVIFNKGTDLEEVFEFIITKVTERHEDGELVCDVECEGLAFHELGKIGYKISLSQDDYLDEWSKWSTETYDISNENAVKKHNAAEPKNNIDYWMGKVLKDTNWTYSIQMDWSGIDGMVIIKDEQNGYPLVGWAIVDKTRLYNGELMYAQLIPYNSLTPEEREQVNAAREGKNLRRCDKIYEDEYVSSWAQVDDSLTPAVTEKRREKYRLFDEEESNIYNLTQTIAETFGVHCKYIYHYDENYHIIGREVVFYNNFLQETTGEISITYPYHAHTIEREMDGTDIVTKMFVKSLDDENTESGWATIMDTEANKSGEDYLLNFDYLYEVGTISEEQYQEIEKYEATLHDLNIQLAPLNNQLVRYQDELIDVSTAKKIARDAMTLDDERISAQDDLLNNLTGGTGRITVDNRSPDLCYLMAMDDAPGYYYIRVRQIGIVANTLQIYKDYNPTSTELSNPISAYDLDYDEFGNLTGKVFKLTKNAEGLPALVYVTYSYEPQLYYENIKKMWQLRKDKDKREYDKQATREEQLDGKKDENGNRVSDGLIQKLEKQINDILEQKEALVKAFERMMGPALREGTWQPEDDYANYGDKYSINLPLNINSQYTNDLSSIGWDNELFDDEDKLYYEYSAAQKNIYYPCVNLEGLMDRFTDVALAEKGIPNLTLDNLSLVFQDMDYAAIENPRFFRYFGFNSQCHLAFVWRHGSDSVMPVLIVEGVESLPTDFDITNEAITHARIGYLNITVTDEGVTNQVIDVISEGEMTWINKEDLENYDIVYPRVKINSSYLKNSEDEISLMLGNEVLDSYYDYYVLSREEINNQGQYANTYFITIKPDAIFRKGSLPQVCRANYCISNTGLLIYLDAIQVLKENAYPKVSYTVDPSVMTTEFVQQAYRTLDKIIRLNDDELKFENVRGYVSELELDLDHPWEDEITITNYKTKFEDLFSNIVAQTEEMKKNSYIIGMAASIFTDKGQLSSDAIQGTILRADLNYAFNQGTLTIDEANGIWGTSDDGVVAFRGGGIFTATEQDADGNWVWNTGILPSGINANLITTGQLDTNLIRIYAGDNLKFQMNGDGLFAYKSWLNDVPAEGSAAETTKADQYKKNVFVPGQYVVHNSEGLFFTAKKGSMVLDEAKENYVEVKQDVDRVAISWDGLTIRNWNNEKVFYADGNGDLTLTGTIHALAGDFKGNVKATSLTIINGESEEETSIDDYLDGQIDDALKDNNEVLRQEFTAADSTLKSTITNEVNGQLSDFEQTINGFETTVKGYDDAITQLEVTAEKFETFVGQGGDFSLLQQTVNGLNSTVQKDILNFDNPESLASKIQQANDSVSSFVGSMYPIVNNFCSINWNYSSLTAVNNYYFFICGFGDDGKPDGTRPGYIMWKGQSRTVPITSFYVYRSSTPPFDTPVYIVLKLANEAAETGEVIVVWEESNTWKYKNSSGSVYNFSWDNNLTVALAKFFCGATVSSSGSSVTKTFSSLIDGQKYDGVRTLQEVGKDNIYQYFGSLVEQTKNSITFTFGEQFVTSDQVSQEINSEVTNATSALETKIDAVSELNSYIRLSALGIEVGNLNDAESMVARITGLPAFEIYDKKNSQSVVLLTYGRQQFGSLIIYETEDGGHAFL